MKLHLFAGLAVALCCTTYGTPTLKLTSGATVIEIADGDPGDANSFPGFVQYIGSIGNFNMDVTIGVEVAHSLGGDVAAPFLDINSSSGSQGAGGTLKIEFSDTDYGPSSGSFQLAIGGTLATGGSLSYAAYAGSGNGLFEKSDLIGTMGPFTGSPFSQNGTGLIAVSNPYSLTLEVSLTHPASGTAQLRSGFDATIEGCPLITCPPDLVLECPASTDLSVTGVPTVGGQPVQTAPSESIVADACKTVITRTWTIETACEVKTCVQTITVEDTTAPMITGVGPDATISCPATPEFSAPTATDACGTATLTFADTTTPGACAGSYSVTRKWTAMDACGNTSTASQTITVEDTTAPMIAGVGPDATISCPATPEFSTPTATDACGTATLTFADTTTPGVCAGSYSVTRKWTATDACGNMSTASQTITVEDKTAPMITGVGPDATISCPATPQFSSPTATDACGTATLTFVDTTTPGACAGSYSVTRKWTATDACGNTSTASQTITVQDNTPPTIGSAGASKTIACNETPVFTPPSANDSCSPNPSIILVSDVTTAAPGGGFTQTKTWKAVDACGNESTTVSQSITVTGQVCDFGTFNFAGSSPSSGSPNSRTFSTANGVTVKVTAYSRDRGTGAWAPAYVGQYSGGLGVTDSSEDGSAPNHTLDNVGRENYLLFEFSSTVIPSGAYLGYVSGDSDMSIRIGTFTGPISLNDTTLAAFSYAEENDTTSPSPRSTTFNSGGVAGNALIIAASLVDTSPEDYFKVQTLDICVPSCYQPVKVGDFVWNDQNQNGIQDSGEPGINGVKLTLTGTKQSGGSVTLTTTTAGNGGYLFDNLAPGTYVVTVDASNFAPGGALENFVASPTLVGSNRAIDSNTNPTGTTPALLPSGSSDLTLDFGYYFVPPPPPCVASTFNFSGSSPLSGAFGNIRTYTVNGVTVKVSAFSHNRSGGSWDTAYLGAYSGGLGVTDNVEGDGSNNMHTVDNVGLDNFVVFEFSQPITVRRAYLGYVVNDSDLTAWVGTIPGAYSSHISLNQSILNMLTVEQNWTSSSSPRWADLNGGGITGNVLVIAASLDDSSPEDRFKIEKLDICAPPAPPVQPAKIGNFVWDDLNANGNQDSGEPGVDGVKVELFRCADNGLVATTTTSGGGLYSFTVDPGDYYVKFSNLPAGYVFSPSTSSGASDPTDSDANPSTGVTDCTTLTSNETDYTWDAGINKPVVPDCVSVTFDFSGSSSLSGSAGNIRTYTVNGVSVKVSAFSRKSSGYWQEAYLGAYSGGLGVTDTGEGDGSGNRHTVDNIDRINYVLFEFSAPVTLSRAYLGYVVSDSDLSVWIGNASNPYNNHLTLSDSLLSSPSFQFEENDTTSPYPRWADLNSGESTGNVIVLAASVLDKTPDDEFKIQKLTVCADTGSSQPPPWCTKDLGSCSKYGDSSCYGGTQWVKGGGNDIWDCNDSFRYTYQQAYGDCSIVTRVTDMQYTHSWAKAGVMIRESLNSNSKHASCFITPGNGCAFQWRSNTGGYSGNVNEGGCSAPYWVAIVRSGNTFSCYRSKTGAQGTWSLVGSQNINMGSSVYIGLAVTSHDDTKICKGTFDYVTCTP